MLQQRPQRKQNDKRVNARVESEVSRVEEGARVKVGLIASFIEFEV